MISQELFSEVLGIEVFEVDSHVVENRFIGFYSRKNMYKSAFTEQTYHTKHACWLQHINIYELANKNLKEWAKLKNVFDIIDWSEEPEQIFKKVEELRNEIN